MTNDFTQAGTDPTFTILVSLRGGLGNRLLGLLSAWVVSDELRANLQIIWEPDSHCPAPFEALFEPTGIMISGEHVDDNSWPQRSFPTREFFAQAAEKATVIRIRPNPIFGEDLFSANVFTEKLQAKLALLQPAPTVAEMLKAMPKTIIGLHVRLTDNMPCQLLTPKWLYRLAIEEALANGFTQPILVCTDTPEFFQELKKIPGSNIVRLTSPFTSSQTSRASIESIQYAMADLLLLARCEIILASSSSSFARVAHIIGRNELFALNGLPPIGRSKQSQIAWWIARFCELDLKKDKWVPKVRVNWFLGVFAVVCSNLVTSTIYQSFPLPFQRKRNQTQLRRLFRDHAKVAG